MPIVLSRLMTSVNSDGSTRISQSLRLSIGRLNFLPQSALIEILLDLAARRGRKIPSGLSTNLGRPAKGNLECVVGRQHLARSSWRGLPHAK